MAIDDTATWDAAPVDPALWRAMAEIERLYEQIGTGDVIGRIAVSGDAMSLRERDAQLIVALHTYAPALIAAVRRLAGRNLDLEATVAQQGAALEATESARLALQQALGDLLRSCEHVAQVTDDPVYDAAQEIWSASLTTEDERRMRRAALAEGSE